MKKPYPISLALLPIILILFVSGCKKDLDFSKVRDISWNPDFVIPLVNDSITFESALIETGTEKNFYIDESGDISILLYFHDDAFRIALNDLLQLPDFDFSYSHQFTLAEQQIIATQDFPIPAVNLDVDLTQGNPGVRIDKLLVKEGTIVVNTANSFANAGYMTFSILNATRNGLPFSVNIGPMVTGNTKETIDISGVLFDLTSNPNHATVQISGLLKQSSSPVQGDLINSDLTLSVDKIGWFEGYLGQQSFTPPEESVKITVFNNAYNYGDIFFVDPKVSMTLYNSIGVPARITVQKLEAVNENTGASLDIASRLGAAAIIPIPAPSITSTTPTVTHVEYNNSNTGNSINDMFNVKPDYVYYKIKTELNPAGPSINFFSDTSSFYADLHVQLPLYGHFSNITVMDTFSFSINDEEEIENLEFMTNIENGLPLRARVQVYFIDPSYHVLDSLTGADNILINQAPVDPATHLPYPGIYGVKDTSFFLDRARIERITGANKFLVKAILNSTDGGQVNVKIRANQRLKLNFAARVKMHKMLEP